jgi:hypothetical protein
MKVKSVLNPKHVAWAIGALVAAILVNLVAHSGAKASVQPASSPFVKVVTVEQKDIPRLWGVDWNSRRAGERRRQGAGHRLFAYAEI